MQDLAGEDEVEFSDSDLSATEASSLISASESGREGEDLGRRAYKGALCVESNGRGCTNGVRAAKAPQNYTRAIRGLTESRPKRLSHARLKNGQGQSEQELVALPSESDA
mmetsp:Transcript_37516/g.82531  ORF Transcript_37516/g.82531 Transcript_37516/m.82531 type:complete len:110 (-) Transcript_37516:66-395(-)